MEKPHAMTTMRDGGPGLIARKRGEQGFSLIMLSLAAFVMIGMIGLATDVGRMFILKNELQMFADASAMAAVSHMDGSQTGIQGANAVATAGPLGTTKPNGYNFDTVAISNVTTGYATSFNGSYDNYTTANGNATNNYRFISITATANLSLNFLPALPGISATLPVSATAIAGENPQSTFSNGRLLPFAPDAHNQLDTTNFGLTPGDQYTLKWGNGNTTTCTGDAGFTPPGSPPSEHGFVDVGEGNSNANVRTAIEYGGYPNANSTPSSVATGDSLKGVPGNRGTSIFDALAIRAGQDTNDTATTYAAYLSSGTGNGRRVVTVAIGGTWSGNGNNAHTPVLGFANFFLNTTYSGTSGPICATYIGPADINGSGTGGTDGTKYYVNFLYK
jgi:Flp pilus assembly protein TadG